MAKGKISSRSKLGITYIPAGNDNKYSEIVSKNKLPEGTIVIMSVDSDSDVGKKNIRTKDLITHVNGKPLTNPDILSGIIVKSKPGDEIELSIARVMADGKVQKFNAKVKLVEQK